MVGEIKRGEWSREELQAHTGKLLIDKLSMLEKVLLELAAYWSALLWLVSAKGISSGRQMRDENPSISSTNNTPTPQPIVILHREPICIPLRSSAKHKPEQFRTTDLLEPAVPKGKVGSKKWCNVWRRNFRQRVENRSVEIFMCISVGRWTREGRENVTSGEEADIDRSIQTSYGQNVVLWGHIRLPNPCERPWFLLPRAARYALPVQDPSRVVDVIICRHPWEDGEECH